MKAMPQKEKVKMSSGSKVQPVIVSKFALRDKNNEINISKDGKEKLEKLSDIYGGKLEIFVPLSNFSENGKFKPPSGIAVQAKKNETPVIPDLFDDKMFKRVFAFKLPIGARILGLKESISEEMIWKNSDKIKVLLNQAFSEEHQDQGISSKLLDKKTNIETKEWKDEMGHGGSFIGLFASSERGAYHYENQFYLVGQTYSPSANKEIHELMEDAAPSHEIGPTSTPKVVFENFFDLKKNKKLSILYRMSTRNSQRQLGKFAQLLQLQDSTGKPIEFEKDSMAHGNAPWLLHPDIDMITNAVENYNGNMVYRNGAIDPSHQKNGIIFCESPFLGVSILKGPSVQGLAYGGSWKATDKSLGSFPVSTGRQKNLPTLTHDLSIGNYVTENGPNSTLLKPFTWSDDSTTKNLRLVPHAYRTRDDKVKNIERELHYDHSNGEIQLKPLLVKIAVEKK